MSEATTPHAEKSFQKSGRSTVIVMIGTALSRVMGYARVFVFAYVFGSTGLADVIAAVISIPESFRALFAEGALSSAFIPTLSTALVRDPSGERARRIVSNLFGFVLVVLVPLCSLGVLFNTQVVNAFIRFNDTKLYVSVSAGGERLAAAADDGAFHYSGDGGATWTDRRSEHKWTACAMAAEAGLLLGAVKGGSLYFSRDEGATWQAFVAAGERDWSAVGLSADGAVMVARLAEGVIFVSRDGGRTLTAHSAVPPGEGTTAALSPDGRYIIAGLDDGTAALSVDGGAVWSIAPGAGAGPWISLSLAEGGSTALGAGADGFLYRLPGDGTGWTKLEAAGQKDWSSVALSADGTTCYAAVSEGSYFVSADAGASWIERKGAGTFRWKMGWAEKLFPYDVWFLLFISLSAILMGALNSKQVFVIPALTPILFSVTVIASVLWLPLPLEYRMIAGIVCGGVAQVLFQIPSFLRARYRLLPNFRFHNPEFRQVLVQWLPVVASASVFAANSIIARVFASTLEPGSITALYNAVIFFQLPLGIFANSVITVLFPRLSRQAALQNIAGLKETLRYGLRFMLLLLAPATLLLVSLSEDVIGLTLQHGAFTLAGTRQAAPVLAAFIIGLFPTGALYLFQRLHYALKDFKRPLITAGIIFAVDVGLSFVLKETPLRVAGLALASSISFTLGLIIFVVMTRRRLGPLGLRRLAVSSLRVLAGNLPLALIIAAYLLLIKPAAAGWPFLARLILLSGVVLAGFGVTIGMYLLLKIDIVKDILKERFGKKRRS